MGKRLLFFVIFFVSVQCFSQCPLIISVDSVSCTGGNDGSITITPTVPGYYEYNLQIWNTTINQWTPFATIYTSLPSYTFSVQSDSFRVLVEDTLLTTPPTGCISIGVFVPQPPNMSLGTGGGVDETFPGACDGYIGIVVSGGTPPYSFAWTGPNGYTSTNQNIYNLCAGIYNLTFTDNNGCFIPTTFTINSPIICDIFIDTIQQVMCPGGNDGSAIITNGSASFQVFLWENLTDGNIYGNGPATTNTNLASGWYRVTGTDVTGNCPVTQSDSFYVAEPNPFYSKFTICLYWR